MNYGLITSFVVAGILLLSILSMNKNVSRSSTDLTMRQIMQQRTNDAADILQNDIQKLGYHSTGASPVQIAESNQIKFTGDIDNSGTEDVITWKFAIYEDSEDKVLIRSVEGDPEPIVIRSGVTAFDIEYLDSSKEPIIDPASAMDQIRHFKISMTLTSPEPVGRNGDSPEYIKTSWERTFTPINLTL